MNKDRRKELSRIVGMIEGLSGTISEAISALESARDEEQEYFDAMPESFQGGEKGEQAQASIDNMGEAISALEEIDLDAIIGSIEAAQE